MVSDSTPSADLNLIFGLFFDGVPVSYQTIGTSRSESDFRETNIVETNTGKKYVLKLADNDFTFPEKIEMWRRTAEEYRKLGYYCPTIYRDKNGGFPYVVYEGRRCVAYAEDFAPYRPIEDRSSAEQSQVEAAYDRHLHDIWRMTARIASQYFDYTQYPSAYCLFTKFCPSDENDEVLDNALEWKAYAETLPNKFQEQVQRIWRIWEDNRNALSSVYGQLPSSVFQGDLNATNILIDDQDRFVGIFDFNLAGREVFLNYLMRENYGGFEKEIEIIRDILKTVSPYYRFSEAEKKYALMLYRCLKPLWYNKITQLKECGNDASSIRAFLDKTEYYLTASIGFSEYMD